MVTDGLITTVPVLSEFVIVDETIKVEVRP